MQILMIAINDPAGTAIAFCDALNRHTAHSCRLATLETRYTHAWRKDLHVPDLDSDGLDELRDLLAGSDVLHFHMTADEHTSLGPLVPARYLAGKALVHHHHGHPDFRSNPQKYQDKYRSLHRKNLLVSTPDLLPNLPGARWQPNLVPESSPAFMPRQGGPRGTVTVSHSPTRKDLKNTDDLLAALRDLHAQGTPLDLDLIDDVPHAQCLQRKRQSDIHFDHMQGYYGVSSLEGLAQGLPTIAGLSPHCAAHMRQFAQTEDLPWVHAATREELTKTLARLAANEALRTDIGARSRAFMETRWSEARVVNHLADFYAGM